MRYVNKNFFVVLWVDAMILLISLYIAHVIGFGTGFSVLTFSLFKRVLIPILFLKLSIFYFFDLYNGMWRYTGIVDLINIIKASSFSTLLVIAFLLYNNRFEGFSRAVFAIDWCFNIIAVGGFRLLVRYYFENSRGQNFFREIYRSAVRHLGRGGEERRRLLIIGAGDCGEKIFREIRNNPMLKYRIVGFLDDHKVKIGKKIHGVPVLNNIANIKSVVTKVKADEAIIAVPSATTEEMRRIVRLCKESGINFKTVPNMGELINGTITVNAIREVAYRDLLRREVVKLDADGIGAYLKGRRVMVTGAGGSIGSELCKQICRFDPEEIVLFERAETPLYEIEMLLRQFFPRTRVTPILGDILDRAQLDGAFSERGPAVVFHAAAYKHVPMLEAMPWKAVENNIIGTVTLMEAAKDHGVDRFVLVSTDKAVRPGNVMGVTKRVAEMVVQNQNSCGISGTRFMTVRFGNVVGSSGSVVPLFKRQIEEGGPVTVTHPDVTRYFMTIPEASQLILQAGAMGEGGEIFILDMGEPIKIVNMAKDLIRLSGLEVDRDIRIDYIGLRPGEKLYEELITSGEGIVETHHEKIMVLKGTECSLPVLNGNIKRLAELARARDSAGIRKSLKKIVPEYVPGSPGASGSSGSMEKGTRKKREERSGGKRPVRERLRLVSRG